jgi:hypothetical protein
MNKLYVLENLNNVIAKEQNTPEVLMTRKKYLILDKFCKQWKIRNDVIYINFATIFIDCITYDIGKIQTKYRIEIDMNDVVDIKYEEEVGLKLTNPDFLNVEQKEIWEVGGIKEITDKNAIDNTIVGKNYEGNNVLYQNEYDFKINGWKVPQGSFLTLTSWEANSKKNILYVLIQYEVYMFFKLDKIFSLERC